MVILLDTNLIIDHLRLQGFNSIYTQLINNYLDHSFAISPITIQELFTGQSTKSKNPLNLLITTLSELDILHYTSEVAELSGQLTRDSHNNLQFADAAIAATAIHYQSSLATLNTKAFENIPNLQLISLVIQ